jgi:hypothetical protein
VSECAPCKRTDFMAAQETKTFTERLEDGSDRYLALAELFLVIVLTGTIAVLALLTLAWIVRVFCLDEQQRRLTVVLRTLSENWKACLILLVPLFYRTIRKFIARITKLPGGVEAVTEDEKAKPELSPIKPNPPAGEQS